MKGRVRVDLDCQLDPRPLVSAKRPIALFAQQFSNGLDVIMGWDCAQAARQSYHHRFDSRPYEGAHYCPICRTVKQPMAFGPFRRRRPQKLLKTIRCNSSDCVRMSNSVALTERQWACLDDRRAHCRRMVIGGGVLLTRRATSPAVQGGEG